MEESVFLLVNELSQLYASKSEVRNQKHFINHVFSKEKKNQKETLIKKNRQICFDYILGKKLVECTQTACSSSTGLSGTDLLYNEALKLSIGIG